MTEPKYIYKPDKNGRMAKHVLVHGLNSDFYRKMPERIAGFTFAQVNTQDHFELISEAYKKLSQIELEWWSKLARDRNSRKHLTKKSYISGRLLYFASALNLMSVNEQPLKGRPMMQTAKCFVYCEIKINKEGKDIDITLSFIPEIAKKTKMLILATAPLKMTILKPNKSEYKPLGIVDSKFKNGSSITEAYINKFGNLPEEEGKMCFMFKTVNLECGSSWLSVPISIYYNSEK